MKIQRREFLKLSGLSGAGALTLGFSWSSLAGKEPGIALVNPLAPQNFEISPFISIENTGRIVLYNPKPDMGQGTFQAIPMLIAEELEVEMTQIEIVHSDGTKKYGGQGVGGSSSVRTNWEPMRKVGAAAREMLIAAAADRWKVSPSECYAEAGKVIERKSGKSLSYGELAEDASKKEVPKSPTLKDSGQFRLIGKHKYRNDIPSKVNGSAIFGMDQKVEGMLYASIERSPAIGGSVKEIDDRRAKAVKGVKHVLKSERRFFGRTFEGVAVLADSYWAATQGRKALRIGWDEGSYGKINTEALFKEMHSLAESHPGNEYPSDGDFTTLWKSGEGKKLEALYETPFLAHAPMEPQNAIVHVKGEHCEVWAPTQGPDGIVRELAQYLKIPVNNIKVHVAFMGGAFGRKAFNDYVCEAAYLSKQTGAPVKVVWTREDDISQGPFRPGAVSKMQGVIDAQGNITGFHHKVVAPSIMHQLFSPLASDKPDGWAEEVIGKEDCPYKIPHFRRSHALVETDIPLAWWRAVYSSTNSFGHECFLDELAHAAGKDPLALRIALSEGHERFTAVLRKLEELSGWKQPLPEGKARGVALTRCFGSISAAVITVARKPEGGTKIEKVLSVIDCGIAINPDNVKAQTEGNIVMGLTAALKDPISFEQGKAKQSNFHNYRVLRMNEVPEIEVHVMQNEYAPSGVGEPGLPPIAPALCNAVFALSGERIRKLPFTLA
jgi:isoquinoline 1-oxidoreductase beta subunit